MSMWCYLSVNSSFKDYLFNHTLASSFIALLCLLYRMKVSCKCSPLEFLTNAIDERSSPTGSWRSASPPFTAATDVKAACVNALSLTEGDFFFSS